MGVAYYGNYLLYLESARTGLLREAGFAYGDMEKSGLYLPVTECKIQYKGWARFDEEIQVATVLSYMKNASIKISYKVESEDGREIALAYTIHPFVNQEWKIVTIPDEIKEALSQFVSSEKS
jgi:acyl-CoA thioester hydrolase